MQAFANMGVAVLLINEVETITGNFRATIGISLHRGQHFLRYMEAGKRCKVIGVLRNTDSEENPRLPARHFQQAATHTLTWHPQYPGVVGGAAKVV